MESIQNEEQIWQQLCSSINNLFIPNILLKIKSITYFKDAETDDEWEPYRKNKSPTGSPKN